MGKYDQIRSPTTGTCDQCGGTEIESVDNSKLKQRLGFENIYAGYDQCKNCNNFIF